MIHLVNKVYITYAESDIAHKNDKVVGEHCIRVIGQGLVGLDHADEKVKARNIINTPSLTKLVEYFGSDQALFDFMINRIRTGATPKITMYLDQDAMLEILIRWWKALMPNLTAETGYALYKNYGDAEILRSDKEEVFIDYLVDSSPISFKDFANKYWGKTQEEFIAKFESLEAFQVSEEVLDQCSIEFLMVNYLLDNNFSKKNLLLERISKFYKKTLVSEIFHAKREIERRTHLFMNDEAFELNGQSVIPTIQSNIKYNFLLDPMITKSTKTYDYLKQNTNLRQICLTILRNEIEFAKYQDIAAATVVADFPAVNCIAENKEEPTAQELLDQEVNNESKFRLFKNLTRSNRYNSFLFTAVKNSLAKDPESNLKTELKLAHT